MSTLTFWIRPWLTASLLLAAALPACQTASTPAPKPGPTPTAATAAVAPAPSGAADTLSGTNPAAPASATVAPYSNSGVEDMDHKILPLEVLRVDVFGEKELSFAELRVQAGGTLKYFLLGDIPVSGKTPAQAADLIREMLKERKLLVDPQVVVTVAQYRKRYVSVTGEVVKPGSIPLLDETPMTILDAIGLAGGLNRAANKRNIQFTRRGHTTVYNLDKLNKDPNAQILIESGDGIYVPQTAW